jgi:hypothetical protein
MKTFLVRAKETLFYSVRIEANTESEAIEIVEGYEDTDALPYETGRQFEIVDATEQ